MSFNNKAFDPISPTVTLNVTDTSGVATLSAPNAADLMIIQNVGANTAYIRRFTLSGGTAATTDFPLQSGAAVTWGQHTSLYLAAICDSTKTTTLKITSGSGNPNLMLSAEVSLGSLTVTADATATAAAPSYTEGTANPLSQDLTGNLRTASRTDTTIAPATATATKSTLLGVQYNSTQATFTNGQQGSAQASARGAQFVAVGAEGFAVTTAIPSGTYTDKTITSMSGSSQTLIASNAARKSIVIQNTGNANIGVSLSGGTAVIGGAATITLTPGTSYTTGGDFVPTNAITVIGTAGQAVAAFEG